MNTEYNRSLSNFNWIKHLYEHDTNYCMLYTLRHHLIFLICVCVLYVSKCVGLKVIDLSSSHAWTAPSTLRVVKRGKMYMTHLQEFKTCAYLFLFVYCMCVIECLAYHTYANARRMPMHASLSLSTSYAHNELSFAQILRQIITLPGIGSIVIVIICANPHKMTV